MAVALVLIFCSALSLSFGQWFAPRTPQLFRPLYFGAAGEYNGTIYLFGGDEFPTQLMRYNISQETFTDDGVNATNVSISGWAQFYTQINEMFYTISPSGDQLNVYNMKSNHFIEDLYSSVPINVDQQGCLASDSFNRALFITMMAAAPYCE